MTLLALALLAAAPQAPPSFAAGVEAVSVDVFVSDGRDPVSGLTAADFELRDDGVRQPVELAAVDSLPLATLLVLDTSDSVSGEKLRQLQAASRALLQRVRPGDTIGLVTFSHQIGVRVPPTTDHEGVARALASVQPGGTTALYDALYAGVMLAPAGSRSLLVLFTDGEDNLSWLTAPELTQVLLGADVLVHAVGVVPGRSTLEMTGQMIGLRGRELPPEEPAQVRVLRQLAETTGGSFWAASAPDRLAAAFVAIMDAMKARYILRYEPQSARRPGLHRLEVKLTRRRGTVRCRRAYYVGPVAAPRRP